jgi:hypothetical protein
MCEDFTPKWGDKKLAVASRELTVFHFLLARELLTKNDMSVVLHPTRSPDFPPRR